MRINPVHITPKAVSEIREILAHKNIPVDYGLRVGISGGGGCGGMSYILGFDKKKDGDLEYLVDNITVYIDKKFAMYLLGMEIDFYEGADARGFTFVRPDEPKKAPDIA